MQVRHSFARVGAVIEHEAESVFGETELLGDCGGFDEQMAEHLVIVRVRFGDARNRFLGNDQDVDRRLRFHVVEGNDLVVFVNDFGGNFACDDFFEKGFAHGLVSSFRFVVSSKSRVRRPRPQLETKNSKLETLFDQQRALRLIRFSGEAVAEEFHDLILQRLAPAAPAPGAGELLHTTAQAAKMQ